ncbi:DUF3524 domain-containing protein [Thioalkalivibrio sp. ALJ16]|uniref:tRNA-queuosine alpha-mannosyltransferase domain-containing protein n=1 Tax=Thioalkalivibrio sp. ALJ16 TaxID=1158762 RepID=UPI0003710D76|nr:DUF3524 domain-containing protein [Thioalkalivibrio sp. ALJ16]
MPERPTILLLSAYRADSHAAWADWLTTTFDAFDWQVLELPGRHFRWRIRGNPISWLDRLEGLQPDAVIASSMVDLATLRGLHPALARSPTLYYVHENQFAYPRGQRQHPSLDPQMVQLYAALAADRVLFNSAYNRDSFLDGVETLLARMPDAVPAGLGARLRDRSRVLPVPIRAATVAAGPRDPGLILWNHRWEYDKAPETFAAALNRLTARGVPFRLALLGARPEPPPKVLTALRERLGGHIVADRHLPRSDYEALLARAGIAVSTAVHEFQGLAMLEATAAGATPLVPDALAYREQYPDTCRYPAADAEALATRLQAWLQDGPPPAPDVRAWTEPALRPRWEQALEGLLGRVSRPEPRSRPRAGLRR